MYGLTFDVAEFPLAEDAFPLHCEEGHGANSRQCSCALDTEPTIVFAGQRLVILHVALHGEKTLGRVGIKLRRRWEHRQIQTLSIRPI